MGTATRSAAARTEGSTRPPPQERPGFARPRSREAGTSHTRAKAQAFARHWSLEGVILCRLTRKGEVARALSF